MKSESLSSHILSTAAQDTPEYGDSEYVLHSLHDQDFMDDDDGGGEEDENIENREGTGETREAEEEMIWSDSASSRDGRISEESDIDSDAASGDVQSFPHDDDGSLYERDSMDDEDDGEWEAGGREDENIENQEGTRETRAVGKKRPQSENASSRDGRISEDSDSSRDGRISEDSDTDSDVVLGVVLSFPHHNPYEWDSMDDEDDGEQGAGGREDENIEYREGTGETRKAGKKRTWSDNASNRDGRISEESDTDIDVASGNVQNFPYDETHVDGDGKSGIYTMCRGDYERFQDDNDNSGEVTGQTIGVFEPLLQRLPETENPKRAAPLRGGDYESFEDDSENAGLEQQPDAESLLTASRTLGNPSVADLVEEIGAEGINNHNQEQQHTVATDCVVVQREQP